MMAALLYKQGGTISFTGCTVSITGAVTASTPELRKFQMTFFGGKRAVKLHGLKRLFTSGFNGIYN